MATAEAADPGVALVQRILSKERDREAEIDARLRRHAARIEANFVARLNAANRTKGGAGEHIATALEVRSSLGSTPPAYWERYFKHLIEAHQFNPEEAANYLIRPATFVVRFDGAMRPKLEHPEFDQGKNEEPERSDTEATFDELATSFAEAAEQAGSISRARWRRAAKRAECARREAREDASLKLGLIRQAVEAQSGREDGRVLLDTRIASSSDAARYPRSSFLQGAEAEARAPRTRSTEEGG